MNYEHLPRGENLGMKGILNFGEFNWPLPSRSHRDPFGIVFAYREVNFLQTDPFDKIHAFSDEQ